MKGQGGLARSVLGMGNPLLDIMSNVDQAFLDKYGVSEAAIDTDW